MRSGRELVALLVLAGFDVAFLRLWRVPGSGAGNENNAGLPHDPSSDSEVIDTIRRREINVAPIITMRIGKQNVVQFRLLYVA
jgi:hypothetical protein